MAAFPPESSARYHLVPDKPLLERVSDVTAQNKVDGKKLRRLCGELPQVSGADRCQAAAHIYEASLRMEAGSAQRKLWRQLAGDVCQGLVPVDPAGVGTAPGITTARRGCRPRPVPALPALSVDESAQARGIAAQARLHELRDRPGRRKYRADLLVLRDELAGQLEAEKAAGATAAARAGLTIGYLETTLTLAELLPHKAPTTEHVPAALRTAAGLLPSLGPGGADGLAVAKLLCRLAAKRPLSKQDAAATLGLLFRGYYGPDACASAIPPSVAQLKPLFRAVAHLLKVLDLVSGDEVGGRMCQEDWGDNLEQREALSGMAAQAARQALALLDGKPMPMSGAKAETETESESESESEAEAEAAAAAAAGPAAGAATVAAIGAEPAAEPEAEPQAEAEAEAGSLWLLGLVTAWQELGESEGYNRARPDRQHPLHTLAARAGEALVALSDASRGARLVLRVHTTRLAVLRGELAVAVSRQLAALDGPDGLDGLDGAEAEAGIRPPTPLGKMRLLDQLTRILAHRPRDEQAAPDLARLCRHLTAEDLATVVHSANPRAPRWAHRVLKRLRYQADRCSKPLWVSDAKRTEALQAYPAAQLEAWRAVASRLKALYAQEAAAWQPPDEEAVAKIWERISEIYGGPAESAESAESGEQPPGASWKAFVLDV